MKQLSLSSRDWVLVAVASIIVMIGAVTVIKKNRRPVDTPVAAPTGSNIPLNNLDDSPPPPMPGMTDTGGDSTLPPPDPRPNEPPINFDVPSDNDQDPPQTAEQPSVQPVVWVTEKGTKAYKEPGFNMPVERELEQWEELQIVESSKENWDHVRDLQGNTFWVQKKLITVIRPHNLSQPSIAEKKVMDFYTEVAHREHSDAYVHLSPEWKKELSFDRFVKGYSRTDSLRSEIVNVIELGEDRYQVDVSMEAIEEGEPVPYLGIYTVEKVDGKWYLTSGSLNKQVSGGL